MQNALAIDRRRARDQVRDLLRSSIVDGVFATAPRLDEVRLSREIGVSRTPLREALIALEEEGFVCSAPNKGFAVIPADLRLMREIYPILSALEQLAIGLCGEKLAQAVPDLDALNAELAKEQDARSRYDLDMAFHDRLVRDCGNARLLKLIAAHHLQVRRFDGGQQRGMLDHSGSLADHRAIADAIRAGDIAGAQDRLAAHWQHGEVIVGRWLELQA